MGRLGLPSLGLQYRRPLAVPYLLPVPGAILHLRSDIGISTVGADADIWRDLSGYHNDARPDALSFNRPEYQAAGGVNGYPGVYFNRGGWESMDISSIATSAGAASGSYTVYAVFEQFNSHNDTQLWVGSDGLPGGD